MLVLTRKEEESICIGSEIRIKVLSVCNGRVRLGIEAPAEVPVLREELHARIAAGMTYGGALAQV